MSLQPDEGGNKWGQIAKANHHIILLAVALFLSLLILS